MVEASINLVALKDDMYPSLRPPQHAKIARAGDPGCASGFQKERTAEC